MLRSMTGYGRAELEEGGTRVEVEMRSVNHRFLDVVFRTPRELQPVETRIKELIQEKIERGRISVSVNLNGAAGSRTSVSLDENLSEGYFTALSQLKERLKLPGTVDLATLAGMPDLFRYTQTSWDLEEISALTLRSAAIAVDDIVRMKAEEGELLALDLHRRADGLRGRLARMTARMPERSDEGARALHERLNRLLGDRDFPQERLAAEVAILAERLDCTEECVRFGIHVEQFLKYLSDGTAPGRRLNFLLQEMGREVNTMAVKANDAIVSQEAVLVKEELEKMREQVQNVE
jgi:uncharacterized protein (TIGR00255 family)